MGVRPGASAPCREASSAGVPKRHELSAAAAAGLPGPRHEKAVMSMCVLSAVAAACCVDWVRGVGSRPVVMADGLTDQK